MLELQHILFLHLVMFPWVHVAPHSHHDPVNITYITNFLTPFFQLRLAHRHRSLLHRPLIQPQKRQSLNSFVVCVMN